MSATHLLLEQCLQKCGECIISFTILGKRKRYYYTLYNLTYRTDFLALQILTDWHLIGIVLAVTGIDIILLSVGKIIPILRDRVSLEQDTENPQALSVNKSGHHASQ